MSKISGNRRCDNFGRGGALEYDGAPTHFYLYVQNAFDAAYLVQWIRQYDQAGMPIFPACTSSSEAILRILFMQALTNTMRIRF